MTRNYIGLLGNQLRSCACSLGCSTHSHPSCQPAQLPLWHRLPPLQPVSLYRVARGTKASRKASIGAHTCLHGEDSSPGVRGTNRERFTACERSLGCPRSFLCLSQCGVLHSKQCQSCSRFHPKSSNLEGPGLLQHGAIQCQGPFVQLGHIVRPVRWNPHVFLGTDTVGASERRLLVGEFHSLLHR